MKRTVAFDDGVVESVTQLKEVNKQWNLYEKTKEHTAMPQSLQ